MSDRQHLHEEKHPAREKRRNKKETCWSAQVSNASNGLQGSAMFKQKMLRATQVPGSHARIHLRFAFQTFEGMEGS